MIKALSIKGLRYRKTICMRRCKQPLSPDEYQHLRNMQNKDLQKQRSLNASRCCSASPGGKSVFVSTSDKIIETNIRKCIVAQPNLIGRRSPTLQGFAGTPSELDPPPAPCNHPLRYPSSVKQRSYDREWTYVLAWRDFYRPPFHWKQPAAGAARRHGPPPHLQQASRMGPRAWALVWDSVYTQCKPYKPPPNQLGAHIFDSG